MLPRRKVLQEECACAQTNGCWYQQSAAAQLLYTKQHSVVYLSVCEGAEALGYSRSVAPGSYHCRLYFCTHRMPQSSRVGHMANCACAAHPKLQVHSIVVNKTGTGLENTRIHTAAAAMLQTAWFYALTQSGCCCCSPCLRSMTGALDWL